MTNTTPKQPVEGIFFDLDGTLLDTSEDFVAVLHKMQKDDGRPLCNPDTIRKHVSDGSRKIVQLGYQLPDNHPELDNYRKRFLDEYDRHIQNQNRSSLATLYNGMAELLASIEAQNIPWGIITNKPAAYANLLIGQCQLSHRSKVLLCPEHVKQPKPNPESLLKACRETGTTPENCIYIGDHLRDIEAGRNAGMYTITALYGYIPDGEKPELWPADHTIQHAKEILPWLNKQQWEIPRRPEDV